MTTALIDAEIEKKILDCLHFIAPEVDLSTINKDKPLRDQFDIDSLDFVRLVVRLHETMKVDIPERDYPKLATLNSCIEYFRSSLPDYQVTR